MRFLWLAVAVVCLCDVIWAKDATSEELGRLKTYIKDVKYLEELEEENELDRAAEQGKDVNVEEGALRSACDVTIKIDVVLPDDVTEFRRDVVEFAELWNECLGKWYSMQMYAEWDYSTNLTDYNEKKLADTSLDAAKKVLTLSRRAQTVMTHAHYNDLDPDLQRQIRLLALNSDPQSEQDNKDLIAVKNELTKIYSTAKVNGLVLEPDLTETMADSREPEVLLAAWWGWREASGTPMKSKYAEMVRLLNIGATDNGFNDFSDAWIMKQFDITDDFEATAERLWLEIKPLYEELHAYVRLRLAMAYQQYRPTSHRFKFWDIIRDGAIPAHILGNMWAQQWDNIYELVKPFPDVTETDYDQVLTQQNYSVDTLFNMAEEFYTSIGLFEMTEAFNKFSMKTRPENRDVVCHASASDFFTVKPVTDFRIKMCTEVNMEYFEVIHHEMGHIEYFMAYQDQPTIYRTGANSGFHEAIGDTIALSVMSKTHLRAVHLDTSKDEATSDTATGHTGQMSKSNMNTLMLEALRKISFLPFGYMIDKWRWDVFRGNVNITEYNKHWWNLRLKYQGLVAPITRSEDDFDPGAKYHIPTNSPYVCYFISFIIQFQFYESMCNTSGHQGPLHECDFYNSKEAGAKMREMLAMGMSKPWPEAMKVITGSEEMNTSAILKYFKPLHTWLKAENKRLGNPVGWENSKINWRDN